MKRVSEILKKTAVAAAALALLMTTFALGASDDYSTENDPLVSLSYINGVLTPAFEKYVDDRIQNVSAEEIAAALMNNDSFKEYVASVVSSSPQGGTSVPSSSAEFIKVNLDAGKRITASGKCELIVRSGEASVFCATDGAVKDVSASKTLSNGDGVILGDYIEISYADAAGIVSLRSGTEVLVRGEFTVG